MRNITNSKINSTKKTEIAGSFLKNWLKALGILLFILIFALLARTLKVYFSGQPVFADEAIYIRWAQVMKAEPTLRFLPLSDGKQPLYMWILMFLLQPSFDPLIAGRMLSVFFGVVSALGVFILSYILFKRKKAALVAVLIYAISPITVFFDSMALVDSTLAMFGIWYLIFLVLSVKKQRYDLSMIAGFLLGGALLTKSPALYFSLLTPVSLIFINWKGKKSEIIVRILKTLTLFIPIYLIAYGMYNILRLGPNFQLIALRNQDYVFPISHLWLNPKDPFIFHVKEIWEWLYLLGPGVLIFILTLGVMSGIKRFKKETIFLAVWILFPLFLNSMYAKVFTARYILFVMPFIFIMASLFIIFRTKFKILPYFMLVLFILNAVLLDFAFIYKLDEAPLPKSERTGYLEEWTAGYGIKEVADYLIDESKVNGGQMVVGTEGYFGTLPDGLQIYLNNYPQIVVIGVGLNIKELPKPLFEARKAGDLTYLVINSSRLSGDPSSMGLKLIYSFKKPLRTVGTSDYLMYGPRETLYFFQVI